MSPAAQEFANQSYALCLRGPSWRIAQGWAARGSAFLGNELLRAEQLAAHFAAALDADELAQRAAQLNGYFAAVRLPEAGPALAIVDSTRSQPLFHAELDGKLYLSDDAHWVQQQSGAFTRDELAVLDFRHAGFVSGTDTLYAGLKQIPAGNVLICDTANSSPRLDAYFVHRHTRSGAEDPAVYRAALQAALDGCIGRLAAYAGGRRIMLAFSGGRDSMVIALGLKRLGYRNVLAFTYGRLHCAEAGHSRRLMQDLGFDWLQIPYDHQRWRAWFSSSERQQLYDFADGLSSLPHIEDRPAVNELRARGLVPDDCVFVNGHSAEAFLGGEYDQYPTWPPYNESTVEPEAIADELLKYVFWLQDWHRQPAENRQRIKDKLLRVLGELGPHQFSSSLYESWIARERFPKFTVNCVRNYEFQGYDWWLPLWDNEYRAFWCSLPMKYRYRRAFSLEFVEQLHRETTGRPYAPQQGVSGLERQADRVRRLGQRSAFWQGLYHFVRRRMKYAEEPMGWFGITDQATFNRLYHPKLHINSLLALHYLGELELG